MMTAVEVYRRERIRARQRRRTTPGIAPPSRAVFCLTLSTFHATTEILPLATRKSLSIRKHSKIQRLPPEIVETKTLRQEIQIAEFVGMMSAARAHCKHIRRTFVITYPDRARNDQICIHQTMAKRIQRKRTPELIRNGCARKPMRSTISIKPLPQRKQDRYVTAKSWVEPIMSRIAPQSRNPILILEQCSKVTGGRLKSQRVAEPKRTLEKRRRRPLDLRLQSTKANLQNRKKSNRNGSLILGGKKSPLPRLQKRLAILAMLQYPPHGPSPLHRRRWFAVAVLLLRPRLARSQQVTSRMYRSLSDDSSVSDLENPDSTFVLSALPISTR